MKIALNLMKLHIAIAALVIICAEAEKCDYKEIREQFVPFTEEATKCTQTTGYTITGPSDMPSEDEADAICSQCTDYVDAITKMTFPTCTMTIGSKDVSLREWFDAQIAPCGKTLKSGEASGSSSEMAGSSMAGEGAADESEAGSGESPSTDEDAAVSTTLTSVIAATTILSAVVLI